MPLKMTSLVCFSTCGDGFLVLGINFKYLKLLGFISKKHAKKWFSIQDRKGTKTADYGIAQL